MVDKQGVAVWVSPSDFVCPDQSAWTARGVFDGDRRAEGLAHGFG